jgi:hypothetical protein
VTSYTKLPSILFLKVLVNPLILKLLNIYLDNSINKDIKNLKVRRTTTGNNQGSNIKFFKGIPEFLL